MDPIFVFDLVDRLRKKGYIAEAKGDRILIRTQVNFILRHESKQFFIESELRCQNNTPVSRDEIKTEITNATGIAEAVHKFLKWIR